jgi:hypothetical protein
VSESERRVKRRIEEWREGTEDGVKVGGEVKRESSDRIASSREFGREV